MPIRPLPDLRPLADETLISQLKSLVRRERAITLAVLLHLIEVERRGLHLRRYSSLFHYCVDRLGYSGSAAGRRIAAARCLRDFPRAYEMLLEGRLNLSTLCRVARVLTKENEADLLQRVAGKPEKEVERIVAALSRPIQPREIIRPIRVRTGSAGNRARRDPGASVPSLAESGAGVPYGDVSGADVSSARVASVGVPNSNVPSTKVPNADVWSAQALSVGVPNANAPKADVSAASVPSALSSGGIHVTTSDANGTTSDAKGTASNASPTTRVALAAGSRGGSPVPAAGAAADPAPGKIDSSGAEDPLSYRIAITVDEAFMEKLERARSLVSRSRPGVSVADVFCRTMDEFLMRHDPETRMARRQQRTEKKGAGTRSSLAEDASCNGTGGIPGDVSGGTAQVAHSVDTVVNLSVDRPAPQASQRFDPELRRGTPRRSSDPTTRREEVRRGTGGSSSPGFITAAMRDAVWTRDGGRCTYVGPDGRCPETRGLHIDHRHPESLGGVAELFNLRLVCSVHNQSEADRVLGREFMDCGVGALPEREWLHPRACGRRAADALGRATNHALRRTTNHALGRETNHALRRATTHVECPELTDANRRFDVTTPSPHRRDARSPWMTARTL